MSLVEFPGVAVFDIPASLRALADAIERGERHPFTLAWVADEGDNAITMGVFGQSPLRARGLLAHLLFARGQRIIEGL